MSSTSQPVTTKTTQAVPNTETSQAIPAGFTNVKIVNTNSYSIHWSWKALNSGNDRVVPAGQSQNHLIPTNPNNGVATIYFQTEHGGDILETIAFNLP